MWNLIILLVAVFVYYYSSSFYKQLNPVSYKSELPTAFSGPLSQNELLDKTERLHENALHWAESFASHNGKLFTGLGDGRIVQVTTKDIKPVCRIGNSCEGQHEEHICGRPLGLVFNKAGTLFVVDAYHGLFSVNVKSGKKTQLVSSNTIVEDLPLTLMNSLTFDESEEAIYITQSSSRWNLSSVIVSVIEHDTSGRLLKYDMKTKTVSVVLKNLAFPNGVVLTHDGNAVLVAEGSNNKIFKYHIKGDMVGLNKEFLTGLPGEPDNIKRSGRGTYWISVATARTQENPSILDRFSDQPFWRNLILHLHRLTTAPICAILNVLPYKKAKEIGFELKHARIIADAIVNHGMILEFDDKGQVIRSLHSPSGKVSHLSEVFEHDGYLYLGSWRNHYIGRLKA